MKWGKHEQESCRKVGKRHEQSIHQKKIKIENDSTHMKRCSTLLIR